MSETGKFDPVSGESIPSRSGTHWLEECINYSRLSAYADGSQPWVMGGKLELHNLLRVKSDLVHAATRQKKYADEALMSEMAQRKRLLDAEHKLIRLHQLARDVVWPEQIEMPGLARESRYAQATNEVWREMREVIESSGFLDGTNPMPQPEGLAT